MGNQETLKMLPGTIFCDNDMAHHSHDVRNIIVKKWKCCLNYGLPATPLARRIVEYTFNLIEQNIHLLPSTTGSTIYDPIREKKINFKTVPKVDINVLFYLIDYTIADHNSKKSEATFGLSPNDVIESQLEEVLC